MAFGIPPEKLAEVRSRVDIGRVIGRSVDLKKQGRRLVGRCPFHDDSSPSFSVEPQLKLYHCFGCGVGGDVFDFVMRREGVEFPEAVRQLAREFGVDLPERPESPEERDARKKRRQLLRLNELARDFYVARLEDDDRARRYLRERGLAPETVRRWRIGFAPAGFGNLCRFFADRGVPEGLAIEVGLLGRRDDGSPYDRIRGRVVFPIVAPGGEVLGFGARRADWLDPPKETPKYVNSPESSIYDKSSVFFGLDVAREHIRKSGSAVLVEGYMDVIGLEQAGVSNAIASCGTALSQKHAALLAKLAKRVTTMYDADAAGLTATRRSAELLLAVGVDVHVARLPEGEDPDTFALAKGKEAIEGLVGKAPSALDVFVEDARKAHAGEGMSGTFAVVSELKPFLSAISDPLLRDVALDQTARKLGLEPQLLRRHLAGQKERPRPAPVERRAPPDSGEPPPSVLEREVLKHAIENPSETIAEIDRHGATDAITHPAVQTGLAMVRIALRDGKPVDAGAVIEALSVTAPSSARVLRETLLNVLPEPTELTDCLLKLLEKYRDAELRRMARAVGTGVADADTIAKIERLNDRIRELSTSRGKKGHGS